LMMEAAVLRLRRDSHIWRPRQPGGQTGEPLGTLSKDLVGVLRRSPHDIEQAKVQPDASGLCRLPLNEGFCRLGAPRLAKMGRPENLDERRMRAQIRQLAISAPMIPVDLLVLSKSTFRTGNANQR